MPPARIPRPSSLRCRYLWVFSCLSTGSNPVVGFLFGAFECGLDIFRPPPHPLWGTRLCHLCSCFSAVQVLKSGTLSTSTYFCIIVFVCLVVPWWRVLSSCSLVCRPALPRVPTGWLFLALTCNIAISGSIVRGFVGMW